MCTILFRYVLSTEHFKVPLSKVFQEPGHCLYTFYDSIKYSRKTKDGDARRGEEEKPSLGSCHCCKWDDN